MALIFHPEQGKEALLAEDPNQVYAALAAAAAAQGPPASARASFSLASQQIAAGGGSAGQVPAQDSPARGLATGAWTGAQAGAGAQAYQRTSSASQLAARASLGFGVEASTGSEGAPLPRSSSLRGAQVSMAHAPTLADNLPPVLGPASEGPFEAAFPGTSSPPGPGQGQRGMAIVQEDQGEDEDAHVAHLQALLPPAGARPPLPPGPAAANQPSPQALSRTGSGHSRASGPEVSGVTQLRPGELTAGEPGAAVGGWAAAPAGGGGPGSRGQGSLGSTLQRGASPAESATVSPLNRSMQSGTSALNQSLPRQRDAAASAAAAVIGGCAVRQVFWHEVALPAAMGACSSHTQEAPVLQAPRPWPLPARAARAL